MTNAEIIFQNRVFLMEQGVIESTAETMIYEDEQGRREIHVPEEIHTFQEWKRLGFQVRKGEHSVARFQVWKKATKKDKKEDSEDTEKKTKKDFFVKHIAFFFTKNQVSPI